MIPNDLRDAHIGLGDGRLIRGPPAIDTGVAGDWDGDGLDDPARYRASTGDWHFTTRVGEGILVAPSVIGFGANATPVVGSRASMHAVDAN